MNPSKKLKTLVLAVLFAHLAFPFFDPSIMYGPFRFQTPDLMGQTFQGFHLGMAIFHIANFLLNCLLGYGFVRHFFSGLKEPLSLKILACFPIGHTLALTLMRLVTLAFPYGSTYVPFFGLSLAISFFLFKKEILSFRMAPARWFKNRGPQTSFLLLLLAGFSVLVFGHMILHITFLDWRLYGHGPDDHIIKYLPYLVEGVHFPIIYHHYEEFLYAFTLWEPFRNQEFSHHVPMLLTTSFTKASLILSIYFCFRKMGVSKEFSLLGSVFFQFASFSFNPMMYHLLFDRANPLFFITQTGPAKYIAIILFFLVDILSGATRKTSFSFSLFALMGIGLAASSLSNSFLFILYIAFTLYYFRTQPIRINTPYFWPIIAFCLLAPGISYGVLSLETPIPPGSLLILATGLVGLLAFGFLRVGFPLSSPRTVSQMVRSEYGRRFLVFLGTNLIGFVFLGNLFARNSLSHGMIQVLNFFGLAEGVTQKKTIAHHPDFISNKTDIEIFVDARELIQHYNGYCRGFLEFFSSWGLFAVFSIFSLFVLTHSQALLKKSSLTSRAVGPLTILSLATLFAIPLMFFQTDFVNLYGERAWFKTRFLEMPFYMMAFTFFFVSDQTKSAALKFFCRLITILHIVVPFFVARVHIQILKNYQTWWRDLF